MSDGFGMYSAIAAMKRSRQICFSPARAMRADALPSRVQAPRTSGLAGRRATGSANIPRVQAASGASQTPFPPSRLWWAPPTAPRPSTTAQMAAPEPPRGGRGRLGKLATAQVARDDLGPHVDFRDRRPDDEAEAGDVRKRQPPNAVARHANYHKPAMIGLAAPEKHVALAGPPAPRAAAARRQTRSDPAPGGAFAPLSPSMVRWCAVQRTLPTSRRGSPQLIMPVIFERTVTAVTSARRTPCYSVEHPKIGRMPCSPIYAS
jgi:hypothetical protein